MGITESENEGLFLRRRILELEEEVRRRTWRKWKKLEELFIVDTHCRSAFPIQVTLLRHSLHTHQRQKAEFIEQSSRNDQWLLSLRCNLSQSLDAVMHRPLPSVLESEAERLDHSLKEEELRMSISQ